MNDMIKIPYLGMELHIDSFFNGETAQDNKDLLKEIKNDRRDGEDMVLNMALNNFIPTWHKWERKYGHLYGLWNDCIEPQIREWFGFPPSEQPINEDRRRIYFSCCHKDVEVA